MSSKNRQEERKYKEREWKDLEKIKKCNPLQFSADMLNPQPFTYHTSDE